MAHPQHIIIGRTTLRKQLQLQLFHTAPADNSYSAINRLIDANIPYRSILRLLLLLVVAKSHRLLTHGLLLRHFERGSLQGSRGGLHRGVARGGSTHDLRWRDGRAAYIWPLRQRIIHLYSQFIKFKYWKRNGAISLRDLFISF